MELDRTVGVIEVVVLGEYERLLNVDDIGWKQMLIKVAEGLFVEHDTSSPVS